MRQRPSLLPVSVVLAGEAFASSVLSGVTGLTSSPVDGVREDGAEGFFKGVGRGVLGLVTKPIGGAFDMLSLAFTGVSRSVPVLTPILSHDWLKRITKVVVFVER